MPTYLSTRQAGQAALELSIVAPLILGLSSVGIESLHLHNQKHRLHEALLQAGRAAIVHHNQPVIIKEHFERALAKSITRPAAWQIRILSPTKAHFRLLSEPSLQAKANASAVIDNDYQFLASENRYLRHAANTLQLELYYGYLPFNPLLRAIEPMLAPLAPSLSHFKTRFLIRQRISLPMQSHPMLWPDLADGQVIFYDLSLEGMQPKPVPKDPLSEPTHSDSDTLPTWVNKPDASQSETVDKTKPGNHPSAHAPLPGHTPETNTLEESCP